jgi:uncharacterized membrane protein YraQ (UPF0718 family)
VTEFVTIFLALVFEAVPFLLGGVVISVAAGPAIEKALATAALRQPVLGVAAGTSAGLALPMCDCGSRPLAHRLARAGHREFAIAFLVAAPVVNPIVIVTTWLAFRDADVVILRLLVTVLIAACVGLIVAHTRGEIALPLGQDEAHGGGGFRPGRLAADTLHEFFELFPFLIAGAAIAAGVQVFVDQSILTSASGVYLSIVAMMALAFLLSICSSVDAFVAAAIGSSLGTGPALAFLTFGPVVNLKSMPMYLRMFSLPLVIAITVVALEVAFVGAVVAQLRGW